MFHRPKIWRRDSASREAVHEDDGEVEMKSDCGFSRMVWRMIRLKPKPLCFHRSKTQMTCPSSVEAVSEVLFETGVSEIRVPGVAGRGLLSIVAG